MALAWLALVGSACTDRSPQPQEQERSAGVPWIADLAMHEDWASSAVSFLLGSPDSDYFVDLDYDGIDDWSAWYCWGPERHLEERIEFSDGTTTTTRRPAPDFASIGLSDADVERLSDNELDRMADLATPDGLDVQVGEGGEEAVAPLMLLQPPRWVVENAVSAQWHPTDPGVVVAEVRSPFFPDDTYEIEFEWDPDSDEPPAVPRWYEEDGYVVERVGWPACDRFD